MTTQPVKHASAHVLAGGATGYAGQRDDEQPPRGRLGRLFEAADRRRVPLRTILVTVAVVVATYLAGKLIYLLRDILLLMLVAGFTAMLLSPAVTRMVRSGTWRRSAASNRRASRPRDGCSSSR